MKHPSCNSTRRITLLTIIIATRIHWTNGSRTASSGNSAGKSIAEEQESTTRWQKRIKFQLCCCDWLLLPGCCRLKLQSEEVICVHLFGDEGSSQRAAALFDGLGRCSARARGRPDDRRELIGISYWVSRTSYVSYNVERGSNHRHQDRRWRFGR